MIKKYKKNYSSLLFITLAVCFFNSEIAYAQFTLATDNGGDADYSGGFGTGLNGGTGYNPWSIVSNINTGSYIGDPNNDGMGTAGIGTNSFGFFATGNQYLNAERSFAGLEYNDKLSFTAS